MSDRIFFDLDLMKKKANSAVRGLSNEDVIEAEEHLIDSLRTARETIESDIDLAQAAKQELSRLDGDYALTREELRKTLSKMASMTETDLAIAALDKIHQILQEQIAYMEFQKQQRKEITILHESLKGLNE
jgi:uncharacterized protein YpuA (DUF1002 family)